MGARMPIAKYFADGDFTVEQQRTLELAFSYTLHRLNLVDRNDPVCEIVARKIVDAGKDDCRDATSLTERVMRHFEV